MSFKYLDELKMLMVARFPWHPNYSPVPLLASKTWMGRLHVCEDWQKELQRLLWESGGNRGAIISCGLAQGKACVARECVAGWLLRKGQVHFYRHN